MVLDSKGSNAGTGPHATHGVRSVEFLVDRASVEPFVNQGEISSTRNFHPREDGISVRAEGGEVAIRSLAIYELKSMWTRK